MANNFEMLLKLAQEKGPKTISVAVAEDEDVLCAIKKTLKLLTSQMEL